MSDFPDMMPQAGEPQVIAFSPVYPKDGWRCLNIVVPMEVPEEPSGDTNECWDDRIKQWLNSGRFVPSDPRVGLRMIPITAVLLATREEFNAMIRIYTWRDEAFPRRARGGYVPMVWWEPA